MSRTLHTLEAGVWSLASLLAGVVLLGTLGADFPARARSLWWESALLVMAVMLVVLALLRLKRGRALLQTAASVPSGWSHVRAVLRMLLVLPWSFTLLVAAAGFSA